MLIHYHEEVQKCLSIAYIDNNLEVDLTIEKIGE
jgi:hypothetical protein